VTYRDTLARVVDRYGDEFDGASTKGVEFVVTYRDGTTAVDVLDLE
jgi:hypothetical protein